MKQRKVALIVMLTLYSTNIIANNTEGTLCCDYHVNTPSSLSNKLEDLSDLLCKEADRKIIQKSFEKEIGTESISIESLVPVSKSDLLYHVDSILTKSKMDLDISNGRCNIRADETNGYFTQNEISSAKAWLIGGFKFKNKNRTIKYGVHVVSLVRVADSPFDKIYVVDLAYSKTPTYVREYIDKVKDGASRKCAIIDDRNNHELKFK